MTLPKAEQINMNAVVSQDEPSSSCSFAFTSNRPDCLKSWSTLEIFLVSVIVILSMLCCVFIALYAIEKDESCSNNGKIASFVLELTLRNEKLPKLRDVHFKFRARAGLKFNRTIPKQFCIKLVTEIRFAFERDVKGQRCNDSSHNFWSQYSSLLT